MATPLTNVARGYGELAAELTDLWSAHAVRVATKLDAGTYDAKRATADVATMASNAAWSAFLLASEALDAVANLTLYRDPDLVSPPFVTSLPGAKLELRDDLLKNGFNDLLPAHVEPSQLEPGQTSFTVSADSTGHPPGYYRGTVVASKSGVASEQVEVEIHVA
jgi:hypothetical protein